MEKKKVIPWFWLIAGVLCILYCVCIFFFMGFGTKFFLIWGILGVMGIGVFLLLQTGIYYKLPKWIQKTNFVILLTGLFLFLLIQCMILSKSFCKAENGADYVLILGAQVKARGPSDVLVRRLNKAAEYLKDNPDTKVIVSGGQGKNEHISEALGMKDYLVKQCGIAEDRIYMEDLSQNTSENLIFSKQFIIPAESRVVLVTNNFHMYRASKIAKKEGYEHLECLSASSYLGMIPNNLLREFLGVLKDLCFGNMVLV